MATNNILTEIWSFIKLNFKYLLVAALFLMLYFQGCFDRFVDTQKPTRDTSTTTTQVPQPIIIMPPYTPTQTGSTVFPITIPGQYTPSQDVAKLTEQYNELVKQFLAVKTYKDSIQLKDTAGNRVGVVDLTQIVSENQLKSTQPSYKLNFPHTTTTITIKEPYKIRNQVFIGGGVGTRLNTNLISEAELGLMFKNKKENMFGLAGVYDFNNKQPGLKVSYYKKISFRVKPLIP
jgi:hypothetical protein